MEAIATRLEAIFVRLEASLLGWRPSLRLEAIATRLNPREQQLGVPQVALVLERPDPEGEQ